MVLNLQAPWETGSHSTGQKFPILFWNPKVHCHAHKTLQLVSVLKKINPAYAIKPYFNVNCNLFIPSMARLDE
jgi:hypothetical protein